MVSRKYQPHITVEEKTETKAAKFLRLLTEEDLLPIPEADLIPILEILNHQHEELEYNPSSLSSLINVTSDLLRVKFKEEKPRAILTGDGVELCLENNDYQGYKFKVYSDEYDKNNISLYEYNNKDGFTDEKVKFTKYAIWVFKPTTFLKQVSLNYGVAIEHPQQLITKKYADDQGQVILQNAKQYVDDKNHVNKEYLHNILNSIDPIGTIKLWISNNSIPVDHLICDGQYLKRVEYNDLFQVIGTLYGSSDASNFRLPIQMKSYGTALGLGDREKVESNNMSFIPIIRVRKCHYF